MQDQRIRPEFQLCPCGKHGRIIAQGFAGTEFSYRQQGHRMVTTGVEYQMFNASEAGELIDQINRSGLPHEYEKVDLELAWRLEIWQQLRVHREGNIVRLGQTPGPVNFDALHQFIQVPAQTKMRRDFPLRVQMDFTRRPAS